MLKHIHLWIIERRLEHHLGKHDAYLNKVHEAGAITDDDKLAIAFDVLREPPLNKGQRWAEHQKLVGWQMGVLPESEVAISAPRRRWIGGLRVFFRKMKPKTTKPIMMREKEKVK